MSRKNPNGKVVLYVEGKGGVVATADVARSTVSFGGPFSDDLHVYPSTINIEKGTKYQLVGIVKVEMPPPGDPTRLQPMPFIKNEALRYTRTKFFRLMIDLMKLAQFDPFNGGNAFGSDRFTKAKSPTEPWPFDIDFSVSVPEIDAQLYRKYGFTPAMIDFVERTYSYDDGADDSQQRTGEELRGSFHTAANDVPNGTTAGSSRRTDRR